MGGQSPTPTEEGRTSNQGPLGDTGTPKSCAVVLVTVNRGHSPSDHVRCQFWIEFGYTLPLQPERHASQIATQCGGKSETWRCFAVGRLYRYVAPERRASSPEQVKPLRLSGSVRNHVSRNNVKKKRAGYSGRPRSSTGRRRRVRTLTLLAYSGGHNLHSIEGPQDTRYYRRSSAHERNNHGRQHNHLCSRDRGPRNCRYRSIHERQMTYILLYCRVPQSRLEIWPVG